MTLEPQKPGAGGDPSVFTALMHSELRSFVAAGRSGNRAAQLTAWLAEQDLREMRKAAKGESPEQVAA